MFLILLPNVKNLIMRQTRENIANCKSINAMMIESFSNSLGIFLPIINDRSFLLARGLSLTFATVVPVMRVPWNRWVQHREIVQFRVIVKSQSQGHR
jgi:hypothetical protein